MACTNPLSRSPPARDLAVKNRGFRLHQNCVLACHGLEAISRYDPQTLVSLSQADYGDEWYRERGRVFFSNGAVRRNGPGVYAHVLGDVLSSGGGYGPSVTGGNCAVEQ